MTDCTLFEEDLKAYTDGELSWLRHHAVRRHLTQCASCREEISTMTQIAEEMRSADQDEVLLPTLREKILADGPQASRVPLASTIGRGGNTLRIRPALAWGLAGVALVAWLNFIPTFSKVRENARRVSNSAGLNTVSPTYAPDTLGMPSSTPQAAVRLSPSKSPNSASPLVSFGIRLSDREAGTVQTYDLNNPPPSFDSLRQVHKEASIGVQVANPEATGDTVATMVKEAGGYVATNNLSTGDDGLKSSELTVKVPVTQFEAFLAEVAKLGSVQSKNISGEDITEKTSDANQTEGVLEDDVQQSEARLKSLGAKAKWRDEEATRDLRIQLAQARARLVLLKRMAALGTITIDLSQTPKAVVAPPATGGFLNELKATTHDALQSLIGSAGALLALIIWMLAYAPVWIPLLLIARYALTQYQRRAAAR